MNRSRGENTPSHWTAWAATPAAVLLGIVFLLAAAFKVNDPWSFLASLNGYGVPQPLRLPVLFLVPSLEVLVGVMLVMGWMRRTAAMAAASLMVVFIAAIGYGWWLGSLEECGCFGPFLERSPAGALGQDLLFLALAGLVMVDTRVSQARLRTWQWGALATLAALALVVTGVGYSSPSSTSVASLSGGAGTRAGNLLVGEHLLYLFDPDCPHCQEMSPRVAGYTRDSRLPRVTGITFEPSRAKVDAYLKNYSIPIEARQMGGREFIQITGDGSVPQLVHFKDGAVERVWRGLLPSPEELRAALAR